MKIWGYILIGPGRPSRAKQVELLCALGVTVTGKFAPIWSDKIEGGRENLAGYNGKGLLTDRDGLLAAAVYGDRVAVAAPFCLGISPDDARGFIEALGVKGVSLAVSNDAWCISPGGNAEALIAAVKREQNTANVKAYRKRQTSK